MGTEPNGWQTPKTDWSTSDPVGNGDLNRIEGNIEAVELGDRTVDDAQAPSSDTGYLRQLLDWIVNRLKAITGKTNWFDAPAESIETIVNGNVTFSGNKTFNGSIIDKNGNEVTALQIETKTMSTPQSVASGSSVQFDVTGFSFNPTAVLNIYVGYSQSSGVSQHTHQFGGGPDRADSTTSALVITEITCGTNKVTLTVYNQTGAAQYINHVHVTACA